jgi:hypothetical protein
MTDLILVRDFDPAVTVGDVLAMAEESSNCFGLYRVNWNQSFLAADGGRMICWFDGPDAESARMALRQAGAELSESWPGSIHDSAATDAPQMADANVLVERRWDQPVDIEDIQAIEDAGVGCLESHRVKFIRTFFSSDRLHMVCLYQAPDAEAVRVAQRQAGMPVDRIWACRPVRTD